MALTEPTPKTFRFLDLEPELQLMVFEHLCQGSDENQYGDEEDQRKTTRTHFLLSCKSIYQTFAQDFYKRAVFTFRDAVTLISTTRRVSPTCFQNLHHVRLSFGSEVYPLDDVDNSALIPCETFMNIVHVVPALSAVQTVRLRFAYFKYRRSKRQLLQWFPWFFPNAESLLLSSLWRKFIRTANGGFLHQMADIVKINFSDYEVKHRAVLSFKLPGGKRETVRLSTGEEEALPKDFRHVEFVLLEVTMTRSEPL